MKNILFSSHIKHQFIHEIINLYSQEHCIKTNIFNDSTPSENEFFLDWADIIFCEWCGANAVWYSHNKQPNQKLIVRLHRYELFSSFFYDIHWPNVDRLIFISPKIKDLANKFLVQKMFIDKENFDWQFYLDNNPQLFSTLEANNYNLQYAWYHWKNIGQKIEFNKPLINLLNLDCNSIRCTELNHMNGGSVIFNYVKSNMFKNIHKTINSKYHIGLMGMLPKLKRPDIALEILQYLLNIDTRYRLFILGKNFKEWSITANNTTERSYYQKFYQKIYDLNLQNYVIFDSYTDHPENWFSNIGYILSVSDIEGSHQAVAEGMATGSIPVIYGNALKDYELNRIYPNKYCYYDNNIINLSQQIIKYGNDDVLRNNEANTCKIFAKQNFSIDIIKKQLDSLIFS